MQKTPELISDIQKLVYIIGVELDELRDGATQLEDNLAIDYINSNMLNVLTELLAYNSDKYVDHIFIRKYLKNCIEFYRNKGDLLSYQNIGRNLDFGVIVKSLWTPDIMEKVYIDDPFILVDMPEALSLNLFNTTYDVQVTNPDGQYDVYENGITFY
jgi:hypothetical protein